VAPVENRAERRTNATRVVPKPWRTPASLLAAIRQGETAALRALFVFYAPLLRDQARQMGVSEDECADLVTRVLDDFVLRVLDAGLAPYDLARYLVGAVRNEARKDHRGRTRRRATDERAYTMLAHPDQRVVAECHSEYGLRSATSADDAGDPGSLRSAIIKLAQWSALALRSDELALMIGVSRHVPVRDLAAQAGISYGAARVRVHRLRDRFRKLVVQYVASLDAEEQREVERFLRRAGVCLEPRVERTGGTDDTV
jgi:DNA-binding Lrp family transcriptional regulator